jgi:hypothetical protein
MTPLERECSTYVRYLTGEAANAYVIEKYLDFHQKLGASFELDDFDGFLVRLSSRGCIWASLADSYARIFRTDSAVRKKLILVLALLECASPSFEMLDSVPSGGVPGAVLRLTGTSLRFMLTSLAAAAIFAPARLWRAGRKS